MYSLREVYHESTETIYLHRRTHNRNEPCKESVKTRIEVHIGNQGSRMIYEKPSSKDIHMKSLNEAHERVARKAVER